MKNNLRGSSGFGLVELMISMAITTVMVMAIASAFLTASKSQRGIALTSNAIDVLSEARLALAASDGSEFCKNNLTRAIQSHEATKGKLNFQNAPDLPNFPITLSYFKFQTEAEIEAETPPEVLSDLLVQSEKARPDGLVVRSLLVNPRSRLGQKQALVDIEVQLEKAGEVLGKKDVALHRIPVTLRLKDDGSFEGCGQSLPTTKEFSPEEACANFEPKGSMKYDSSKNTCVKNSTRVCFNGPDAHSASCQSGTIPAEFWSACTATLTKQYYETNIVQNGQRLWAYAFRCLPKDSTSIKCDWTEKQPQPGELCVACCEVPGP